MTIGVALNPGPSGNAIDELTEQVKQAADLGIRSIWFGQQVASDSIALAGLVGRAVPGISVGSSAVPISGRHPLLIAAQAQTTQAATHGRYTLGIGLGAKTLMEPAFGITEDRPIRRLHEFLTALRSIRETGEVDFQGELLTARNPWPMRLAGADSLPILVAAMGPQALRVTGELADGTLPFLAGPKTLAEHIVPALTEAAERAGRPAPRVVAMLAAVVTDDVDGTREQAAREMSFYDGIPSYQRVIEREGAARASDLAAIGDEETVAREVRRYFEAGATDVVLAQTHLSGAEAQHRTWKLGGALAAR